MKENVIKRLSDREHVLLRNAVYIGSINPVTSEQYLLEEGKLLKKEVSFIPGLHKIVHEIVDNSIDEACRTGFKFANKIDIQITETSVRVEDNGRGIPVKLIEGTEDYMPVVAFTEAKAGANFEDDANRVGIGMNGVGSFCTAVYSKKFSVDTSDGTNVLMLRCVDNLENFSYEIAPSKKKGTTVWFDPDLDRFGREECSDSIWRGMKKFDQLDISLIKQRIVFLSMVYPDIDFKFNGEKIKFTNRKQFLSMFGEDFEIFEGEKWFVAYFPSENDEFNFFTYVNGLFLRSGGIHIDMFSTNVSYRLREILMKRHKNIKPGDIKNKLTLVAFFSDFPKADYDSQTKERLTNSSKDIDSYIGWTGEDFDNLAKKLSKNKAIIDPITEIYRLKEMAKNQKLVEKKPVKKIVSEKYYPPIGDKKFLFLTEGDSACGSLQSILGRTGLGYIALRGIPRNTFGLTAAQVRKNEELDLVTDVLGLDLIQKINTNCTYENIVFATDADAAGSHIRGLLLLFFTQFARDLLDAKRILILETPVIAVTEKEKPIFWFYKFEEYLKWKEKTVIKSSWKESYKKGLGSWKKEQLQVVIQKDTLDKMLVPMVHDTDSERHLENWVSPRLSDERKKYLQDRSFNLFSI